MERADLEEIERMLLREGCDCDESTPAVLCVNHHIQAAIAEIRDLRQALTGRTVSCEACNGMAKRVAVLEEECRASRAYTALEDEEDIVRYEDNWEPAQDRMLAARRATDENGGLA